MIERINGTYNVGIYIRLSREDEDKTYEENAIDMCESLCSIQKESKDFNTRLTTVEANMDYLMLLNDPDSTSETVTE